MTYLFTRLKRAVYTLLRKSQRYTRTDMVYIAKGTSWMSVRTVVGTSAGLVLTLLLANVLDPEVYGVYQYILAIAATLWAFTLTGLPTAITRDVARGYEGALARGVRVQLVWSSGIAVLIGLGAGYYLVKGNVDLGLGLACVAVATPFLKSFGAWASFLNGKREFKHKVLVGSTYDVLTVLATGAAVLLVPTEPALLVGASLASQALLHVGAYVLVRKQYLPNAAVDATSSGYGFHLSIMNTLGLAISKLDNVLIFQLIDPVAVAQYSIAQSIPRHFNRATQWARALVAPKFSTTSFTTLQRTLGRKVVLMLLLMIGIAGGYIMIAPLLFSLAFSQYVDATGYSQILALGLLTMPTMLYRESFVAHKRTWQLYTTKTIVPIVRLALMLTLIPLWGLWGAVVASVAPQALNSLLLILLFYTARGGNTT